MFKDEDFPLFAKVGCHSVDQVCVREFKTLKNAVFDFTAFFSIR